MVELGQPGDHQGFEEPALRCRAPPEGRRKPRGTPRGVGSPRGPREGPQVSDLGGVARQGADVAALPGRGSGTPHHGCERQQLAPPGLAQPPRPLALPPAQPAAATAPAPTQAAAQMTAQTVDARGWGGELGPQTHAPPTVRSNEGARATSRGRGGGDNNRGREPTAPQPASLTANPHGRPEGGGDEGPLRGPARGSDPR